MSRSKYFDRSWKKKYSTLTLFWHRMTKRSSKVWQSYLSSHEHNIKIQAALDIRGFAIRGFDYLRIHFCNQKFVIPGFSLDYPRIFIKSVTNNYLFSNKSAPSLSAVLVFFPVTPANNKGCLYYIIWPENFKLDINTDRSSPDSKK